MKTTRQASGSKKAFWRSCRRRNSFCCIIKKRSGNCNKGQQKEVIRMNDMNSLSHTKWECKYHMYMIFTDFGFHYFDFLPITQHPQYFSYLYSLFPVEYFSSVLGRKYNMLVKIPPKVSVSSFVGYLKGRSSLMIYEKYPELKYKYRNREFWCRGYYVDTVGKNAKKIEET